MIRAHSTIEDVLANSIIFVALAAYFGIASIFFPQLLTGRITAVILMLFAGKAIFSFFSVKGWRLKSMHLSAGLFFLFLVLSISLAKREYIEIPVNGKTSSSILRKDIQLLEFKMAGTENENYVSNVLISGEERNLSVNHPLIVDGAWLFQYNYAIVPELKSGILIRKSLFDFPLLLSALFFAALLSMLLFGGKK